MDTLNKFKWHRRAIGGVWCLLMNGQWEQGEYADFIIREDYRTSYKLEPEEKPIKKRPWRKGLKYGKKEKDLRNLQKVDK